MAEENVIDVSRYTDTTELIFDVEFITPTFLGGADGNAEIRTAPLKSLIRRWWRISNGDLTPEELWKKESKLFGSTEKNPGIVEFNKLRKKSERKTDVFGKSKVELKIKEFSPYDCISDAHIDIGKFESDFGSVDLGKFLGYGAVGSKTYIKPKTRCSFSLSVSNEYKDEIVDTLFLIHLFGTCGSRSKNGWGSISISPSPHSFTFDAARVFEKFQKNWKKNFNIKKNYPSKICSDEKGVLAWKTVNVFSSWNDAFKTIGAVYYELLFELKNHFPKGRKLLGIAKGNIRLPAQVIIKICPQKVRIENSVVTKYFGLIIHIPYEIEKWNCEEQIKAGTFVHTFLDKNPRLSGWQRQLTGAAK